MSVAEMVYGTSPIKPKRYRRTQAELEELNDAIYDVCEVDHPLTLRGVFYRVVSLGLIEKSEKGYGVIQREVLKMRRSGALPYSWITDGSRRRMQVQSFDGIEEALDDLALSYRRNLWAGADHHVEVWSEKDAITGVVWPVTRQFDVPLMVSRGFASESFLWSTAQELKTDGRPAVILNLGDHDPSGVVAWEDIQKKLPQFAPGIDMVFERVAVTAEQIDEMSLLTRPTKKSVHSRGFEGESVEVDAIPSRTLRQMLEDAISVWMPPEQVELQRMVERNEREGLRRLAGYDWSDLTD